jgi:hypothetical protein
LFFSGKVLPPTFCGGKSLNVKRLRKNIIYATILSEYAKEKQYLLPNTINVILPDYLCEFKNLCFIMTISKAECHSLIELGIDLKYECFCMCVAC